LDGKIWFSGSKNELIKIAGESNLERSVASLMTKSIA